MSPLPEVLLQVGQHPVLAIGIPIGLGGLVGYTTNTKSAWYTSLTQPPGSPPDWAFGPVWTAIYAGAGYASHLVASAGHAAPLLWGSAADTSLTMYYTQLALNLMWMPMFFTAKRPVLALVDILALTATVWKMTANMSEIGTRVSTTWFLAPYCAWLGYATYLNAGLVYLNWDRVKPKTS